jgi:hypothetical protein
MVPTLFAHFYTNGAALYEKIKGVATSQNYFISLDDPDKGVLHLHKRVSGRMVHLELYIGNEKDRGISVRVRPGDEGTYMDYGRQFIEGLKKVVR